MNKIFLSILFVLTIFAFIVPSVALGQYYSQGEQRRIILVDKKVRSLSMDQFYDNISSSTYRFNNGSSIEFQIVVSNGGNTDLTSISVKDVLPSDLKLVFFPGQNLSQEVNWTIDRLSPGEYKNFIIRATVKTNSQTAFKQINTVEVNANGVSDSDNATYYIDKTIIPVTGNSDFVIRISILLSLVFGCVVLRKLARGY